MDSLDPAGDFLHPYRAMRFMSMLPMVGFLAAVAGCTGNTVRMETGVSPMITRGAGAYDGSGKKTFGTSPKLRRMERMHRFVYCDAGRRFNGFAGTSPLLAELRPRRAVAIGRAQRRGRATWKFLCGFDLRRNANKIEAWVDEVHRRRDADRVVYGRWLAAESRNPRLAARVLRSYWCGSANGASRIGFLRSLKKKAIKLYPSAYTSYALKMERAERRLRQFCRPRRSAGVDVLWTHNKARESRRDWDAALFAVPHLRARRQ